MSVSLFGRNLELQPTSVLLAVLAFYILRRAFIVSKWLRVSWTVRSGSIRGAPDHINRHPVSSPNYTPPSSRSPYPARYFRQRLAPPAPIGTGSAVSNVRLS
jgi:hypothetical protein